MREARAAARRAAAGTAGAGARPGSITPLALGSIGCGVGATAIATTHGAARLAVVAWLAIVAISAAYAQAWRR